MDVLQRSAAIARSLGISVEQATELDGGNQNHVVRVRGGRRDVVVRFAKDDTRMLVDPFDVEAWCLTATAEAGIHTSPLVARGTADGLSYLVVGHLPGTVAAANDLHAWREIGRIAAALAEVDVATAPDAFFTRFGRNPAEAWDAHLGYNFAALEGDDPLVDFGIYREPDRSKLRNVLASLRARRLSQGLVHGDLSTRNLLVNERYAVVDWGSAHSGPTCWGDLDQINRWRLLGDPESPVSEAAWSSALGGAGLTDAQAAPVLAELAVLHALDVVRWSYTSRPDRLDELVHRSARLLRVLGLTS
ncbi:aminoglycoside phosphotransferase family protein [Gryllotalpicola koreensis]|uniref:aminoglycoside phosphotransferase family protein n=1 Tax=Gryllotalpicola koreensis TaxID=993086 RepID=UPI0031E2AA5F